MTQNFIKQASFQDWKEYENIRLLGLKSDPQAFGKSYDEEKEYTKERWIERINTGVILLALVKNKVVGTISYYIEQKESTTAHIVGVFVTKEHRGKGIGGQLLYEILRKINQERTIKKALLSVNIEQQAAISLYQKYGFKIRSKKKQVLGDGLVHEEYEMELMLS